jgi:hypothetical protein
MFNAESCNKHTDGHAGNNAFLSEPSNAGSGLLGYILIEGYSLNQVGNPSSVALVLNGVPCGACCDLSIPMTGEFANLLVNCSNA